MAKLYYPQGQVGKVDVFFCTPLHSVEKDRESWFKGQLSKWQDFSRMGIEFHEGDDDHADILDPNYVEGFEKEVEQGFKAKGNLKRGNEVLPLMVSGNDFCFCWNAAETFRKLQDELERRGVQLFILSC